MISDAELEKMADHIFFNLGEPKQILEALRTVRDSVVQLPKKEEVSAWTTVFAQKHLDKDGYRANEWETTTAFMKWLRSQIKTVQPISDQELIKLADQWGEAEPNPPLNVNSNYDEAEGNLQWAFMQAFRIAEGRLLGKSDETKKG